MTPAGRLGESDALLPIDHHARAYQRAVDAGRDDDGNNGHGNAYGNDNAHGEDRQPAYRLYEVQNGNHIEYYKAFYPQLEYILPHAQRVFDLIVADVEQRATLPPNQCIPRGGSIAAAPALPGHCANIFAP